MLIRNNSSAAPHLGGRLAIVLFVFTLLAFVVESQLTQYVQSTLHYRQPFFIFYLVHSSFSIIFPLHVLYLTATSKYTTSSLISGLSIAFINHLSSAHSNSGEFPRRKFFTLVCFMTIGITCPGLLWFAAISLASVSDVTAIWNTNAFFAYLLSVKLFKLKWEPRRLLAVTLATLGVAAVVYGGSTTSEVQEPSLEATSTSFIKPSAPLLGNLLTLVASIGYGLYQVLYKKYIALPSDPEIISDRLYEQIPEEAGEGFNAPAIAASEDAVYPPPFGLHPNFLTSVVGLCTILVLWIPIPILHYAGLEIFRFPPNAKVICSIVGIALSGVVFNSGFMILLGVWGPIITSVGSLLTIVLVFISDIMFGSGLESVTIWSTFGSGVIVAAFTVLAYDMFSRGT